jgi:hypothetical protein
MSSRDPNTSAVYNCTTRKSDGVRPLFYKDNDYIPWQLRSFEEHRCLLPDVQNLKLGWLHVNAISYYIHFHYLITFSEDWKISKLSKPETRYSVHFTGAFGSRKYKRHVNTHHFQRSVCKKSKWRISFYYACMNKTKHTINVLTSDVIHTPIPTM